jgi:glycerol kinase
MDYLLALDQGTTSSRALILNTRGDILAMCQKPFKQYFPKSGLVEHDPEEIWSSQYEVALCALKEAKLKASDISAIGITNQRETTVIWDRKTGKPVCPAIVWQDRRTTEICDSLKSKENLFRSKTGLLIDPYFSGTKIRWILDHIPGVKERALKGELAFGTIDTWLLWKLTAGKVHATDVSNASRTLLFNIHTLDWDQELLDILHIPRSLLPEIRSSSEVYGLTSPELFDAPIRIGSMIGDQQSALFGQNCFDVGAAKATYGTGCFLLMNVGTKPVLSKRRMLTTVAWQIKGITHYALEGSVFIAGAAIQWLRDNLQIIDESSEINTLASSVPNTGGVYFVPAFTGLGAPHWDPHARGAILGISRGTTKAHIALAALEAIAFSAEDVLKAMQDDAGQKITELRVDGGVAASDLFLQIQSDLMQTPVLKPKNTELTALGAAMLAGLAVGVWKDASELVEMWQMDKKFTPKKPLAEVEKMLAQWNLAVERAKNWEMG